MARNRGWPTEQGEFGKFERARLLGGVVLAFLLASLLAYLIWTHGTGLGLGNGHLGSEASFASNDSYLDRGGLWICDHSHDGWRNRAEAVRHRPGADEHLFIRDPDGAGGSCGRRDTDRKYHKHRAWGGGDWNAGGWSLHPNGTG